MALLSFRKYAIHRGVSIAAVVRAVNEGRCPIEVDEKGTRRIDPAKADQMWVKEDVGHPAGRKDQPQKTPGSGPSILESKSIKEAYLARMAKLDFDERMGNILLADDVRRDGYEAGTKIKNALASLPDRLAAEFAGELNQFVIHKRLKEEIDLALKSLLDRYPDPNANT